jgi:hypothetical protein
MLSEDDDFAAVFLLLSSCCIPLNTAIIAQMKLCDFFSFVELQRRYRHIPRWALVDTQQLSFQRLYYSRNDKAFITFTDLDVISFQYLLAKFEPLYFQYSPYSLNGKIVQVRETVVTKGRRRSLGLADCLGLVLRNTRTTGSLYALQMVFGASHSVLHL